MISRSVPLMLGILLLVGQSAPAAEPPTAPATAPPAAPGRAAPDAPGEKKDEGRKDTDKTPPAVEGIVEKAAVTEHELKLPGGVLRYQATAANMLMKDEEGKTKARVFFVSYEKTRPADADPAQRPIMYVFNGGPGAAAVWLHLGTVGPKRIDLLPSGEVTAPPYRLIDNPHTWLDATDLVFIDPVGTGFSRAEKGENREQFFGVREDITWVADFIRLHTTQYQRWASPHFLAGESYGTTRAAGLSEHLLDRHGIALNGIVLISVVLDFQTLSPGQSNDLPYVLYLPSYTAVAAYHKRLPEELQRDIPQTLREVEEFAGGEYLVALARGHTLPADDRRAVVEKLARYTALPADLIDKSNLRIGLGLFRKHLLNEERQTIGRFDGRILGYDAEPASSRSDYDPSLSQYLPVYSSTFNDYIRRVLKYESILPYEVLSGLVQPWRFTEGGSGYLSVADNLQSAIIKNPHLKVLFASGYFDLATPYFATHYTINHLNLSPELRGNLRETRYQGGHMMYHHGESQDRLHDDVADFVRFALPAEIKPSLPTTGSAD